MPKGDGGENMFLPSYMRQMSKVSSFFHDYMCVIDLFNLPILFSQYKSCNDTKESIFFQSWTFSCSHAVFLKDSTKVQTS